MVDLKAFGKWVKEMREEMGLRQPQLAEKTGVPYSRLRAIESGSERSVGIKTREKIMKFFENAKIEHAFVGNRDFTYTENRNKPAQAKSPSPLTIAKAALDPAFRERVESIKKVLNVGEDRAIEIVLENTLDHNFGEHE